MQKQKFVLSRLGKRRQALNQISRSPFMRWIEGGRLPRRFTQPIFTMYNGRTDPVEHVSHFNQRMAMYSKNETLMCKISVNGTYPQAFGSRFIMCSRVPQPLASLLSLSMREGETLKTYSDRYWEMFNAIDGDFDNVAISTFKLELPTEYGLRKSLIGKFVVSIRQFRDWINKYKRVEENQQQGKGKGKVIPQKGRDFRSDCYKNNRP